MSVYLPSEARRSIHVISAVTTVTFESDKDVVAAGERIRFWGDVLDWAGRGLAGREVYIWWFSPEAPVIGPIITDENGHYEAEYTVPWGWSGA
ncbi:MAG: hypothetical protein DRP27_07335, partial [Thermotogae bacterium]